MKNNKTIKHIRLLPVFIIFSVLALSIRINNVFDVIKSSDNKTPFVFHSSAVAADEIDKEVEELDKILENNDTKPNDKKNQIEKDNSIPSENLILQELAERREFLDLRSKEIDKKAIQLKISEEQIDKKVAQLKEYEDRLRGLIKTYDEKEKEKISSLVKLYSAMKPVDAARIFNALDTDIIVAIMQDMKPTASSSILSQMDVAKAKMVTDRMFGNN